MPTPDKQVRLVFSRRSQQEYGDVTAAVVENGQRRYKIYTDLLRHEPDLKGAWKDAVVVWRGREEDVHTVLGENARLSAAARGF